MKNSKERNNYFSRKTLYEWLIIGGVIAILYFTGLHTQIQGTLQQAVLWTGIYDADHSGETKMDGPFLAESDYNFSLTSPEGKRLKLQELKGSVLFINVWASWCPPCIAEMPAIEKLYTEVENKKADIHFLLISKDQDKSKAIDFMKDRDFSMPYYFSADPFPVKFQSSLIPSTYVISKEGQIIYKREGIANYNADAFKNWLFERAQ